MIAKALRTRFAPSPTGLLHLGNVRTALFNYLLAAGGAGVFLLRIEDTDIVRGEEKYEQALQADLQWLGLHWQEGPNQDDANGPYRQSERVDIYTDYFHRLEQRGLAYPCFCTEQELKLSRKSQLSAGKPPRYSGRCYGLSQEQVQQQYTEGNTATLRFHVPDNVQVNFDDKVRGPQTFLSDDIGDFVIRRSNGTSAFFFSNAIDDALMKISLVVRGEDHLTNTPRQIMLLQALELPIPDYAHIALVVADDGAPLSKRHGSRTVQDLRESGFLPLAIVNYLARLGHSYTNNAFMGLEQLAAEIDLSHMHRSPARFDEAQLIHWQKEAVSQASDVELWDWIKHYQHETHNIGEFVSEDQKIAFVKTVRDNIIMPVDAFLLAQKLFSDRDYLNKDAKAVIRETGSDFFKSAIDCLKDDISDFQSFSKAVGQAAGVKGKSLFMPLRASLTGEIHGPEMARLWSLLGRDRILARLNSAITQVDRS